MGSSKDKRDTRGDVPRDPILKPGDILDAATGPHVDADLPEVEEEAIDPGDLPGKGLGERVRVQATRRGYYLHQIREEGEVFDMYLADLAQNEDATIVMVKVPSRSAPSGYKDTTVPVSCTWVVLVGAQAKVTPPEERELKREGRHAGEIITRTTGEVAEGSGGEDEVI